MDNCGTTEPFKDPNGKIILNSIASIESLMINGLKHYMIIRGENTANPVMLHLHGGPGDSETYSYFKPKFRNLEKLFTICYLEQRGSGKSYSPDIPKEIMTLEQMVEDAKEVAKYLLKEFNKDKIFVLGHSWGTILGSFLINKYPEFFIAYIGISHVANQFESEKISLQCIKEEAKRRNIKEELEEVLKLELPKVNDSGELWFEYLSKERDFCVKYGGALYNSSTDDTVKPVLESTEYTELEKENFRNSRGAKFSVSMLWKTIIEKVFIRDLPRQEIPVFILQGVYDLSTKFELAKEYFNVLEAPIKKFYTFENSAHFPQIEEYERFEEIIRRDVLSLR